MSGDNLDEKKMNVQEEEEALVEEEEDTRVREVDDEEAPTEASTSQLTRSENAEETSTTISQEVYRRREPLREDSYSTSSSSSKKKSEEVSSSEDEKVYGGCQGPEAMYVKLISSDGHEFIVKRDHALTSGTIKAMMSGPGQFSENETNQIHFREIPSHVLQKVCMYFTYKVRYTNSSTEIPEFPIAPQVALELLMAANFLDC